MNEALFLRGAAIGLCIAAPVGPIGLLCIRRSAEEGRASGLATGLGAATADALYGAVAAFGLTAVSGALTAHAHALRLGGGAFLVYLGVKTFRAPPARAVAASSARGLAASYLSAFMLTLTNPTTILSFAAVFAGLGLGPAAGGRGEPAVMVAGVFVGSASWWLVLSSGVAALRGRLSERHRTWINRASGVLLAAFGLAALAG